MTHKHFKFDEEDVFWARKIRGALCDECGKFYLLLYDEDDEVIVGIGFDQDEAEAFLEDCTKSVRTYQ